MYSQADLTNINALISGGVAQAMIAGEMVQYRSLAELLKIKKLIKADLASVAKTFMPVRYPATDRGI